MTFGELNSSFGCLGLELQLAAAWLSVAIELFLLDLALFLDVALDKRRKNMGLILQECQPRKE